MNWYKRSDSSERPRCTLVKHDDTRPGADRPAPAVVEVGQRRVRHEKQGVAKFLYPGLEPIRGGAGPVVADGPGTLSQRPTPSSNGFVRMATLPNTLR